MSGGWRTVVLTDFEALSLENGQLIVTGKTPARFPLAQIRDLIITDTAGTVTLALLAALSQAGVNTVFCDKRRFPAYALQGFHMTGGTAGCLMEQAQWSDHAKDYVWGAVVVMKLASESMLLRELGLPGAGAVFGLIDEMRFGDADNKEGLGARLYFHSLFGPGFRRHASDELNAALNYGYSILLSMMTRIITAHGYSPALGIHHKNTKNPFNLACDLMEPFRAFADRKVYLNKDRELDWDYKRDLIALTQEECLYGDDRTDIANAMELFFLDTLRSLREEKLLMKGVHLGG